MRSSPDHIQQHEPTMKQLWIACFTSLLARLPPEEAIVAADHSLELCNEHWAEPEWVHTWQYKHNYSVGTRFGSSKSPEGPQE